MKIDDVYINFWGKPERKFTEMEIALMEGGHSIDQEVKENKFTFLKSLTEKEHASK